MWILSNLVDRKFQESLTRARNERQIASQEFGGILLSTTTYLTSAKRSGGGEKKVRRIRSTPASAKEKSVPQDCKQYGFRFGPRNNFPI